MRTEDAPLTYYPIKGCAATPVCDAVLITRGLAHDRSFMVIGEDGVFRSPRLALIRPDVVIGGWDEPHIEDRARRIGAGNAELWELLGLGEVVSGIAGLRREVGGKAEGGEQVGVEEVVMPDDPVP